MSHGFMAAFSVDAMFVVAFASIQNTNEEIALLIYVMCGAIGSLRTQKKPREDRSRCPATTLISITPFFMLPAMCIGTMVLDASQRVPALL